MFHWWNWRRNDIITLRRLMLIKILPGFNSACWQQLDHLAQNSPDLTLWVFHHVILPIMLRRSTLTCVFRAIFEAIYNFSVFWTNFCLRKDAIFKISQRPLKDFIWLDNLNFLRFQPITSHFLMCTNLNLIRIEWHLHQLYYCFDHDYFFIF